MALFHSFFQLKDMPVCVCVCASMHIPHLIYPFICQWTFKLLQLMLQLLQDMSCFSSVQFSSSVVSNSLQPHGLKHMRPPCPSPTPGVDSNSCPWSQWCHPSSSSSAIPFSSHLQSFPASGSFHIRWPKYRSFSFSISPFNEYSGLISFRMDWLISLQSKGLSRVFNSTVQKHQCFGAQLSLWSISHIHTWLLEKP